MTGTHLATETVRLLPFVTQNCSQAKPGTIIYGFTPAGDPDVAPDGRRLTYTLSNTDRESKKGSSQVWICDIDGANKRQLTFSGERNRSAPRLKTTG